MARLSLELDKLRRRYHTRKRARLDPVGLVRPFDDLRDREVAAMVAAMLAFGSMAQIRRSVAEALARIGSHPGAGPPNDSGVVQRLRGFRHRWIAGQEVAEIVLAIRAVQAEAGSLDAAFAAARRHALSLRAAAAALYQRLIHARPALARGRLLADPRRGSACKRWMLFFRWMTRRDAIDRGGWRSLAPSELILPLDVHTFRAARRMGLTQRRTPDFRAAEEATAALALCCPGDPVGYDFALAHAGASLAPRRTEPATRRRTSGARP